jgi:phosphatidylinositol glycan class B
MVGDPNPQQDIITRRLFQRLSTDSLESTDIQPVEEPVDPPAEVSPPRTEMMNIATLFMLLLIFRIYNSLLVITWFDPDETWQSLEVAHQIVFGRGKLTWEWSLGIRSSLHPMLFAGVYKAIQWMGLENTSLLVRGPRMLQAVFSASSDLFAFMLGSRLFGPECGRWTLFCVLCNWFNFYCGIRTYSNSLEASLTMMALYHWPFPRLPPPTRNDLRISLTFAAFACIVRPTSLLIWGFLGLRLLQFYPLRTIGIIYDAITTGLFVLGISVYVDFWYYQKWILVQWQFLKVNVLENISEFYGTHPFHWYFSQGIPLVIFTFLPVAIYGYTTVRHPQKKALFWMAVFVVLSLSGQKHKEFRFLLPLVSPLMIYAGRGMQMIAKGDRRNSRKGKKAYANQILAVLLTTNVLIGYYFSRVHKRGVYDTIGWLRGEIAKKNVESILFLMPCHSTPYYSHLHADIPLYSISCEPPLGYF